MVEIIYSSPDAPPLAVFFTGLTIVTATASSDITVSYY